MGFSIARIASEGAISNTRNGEINVAVGAVSDKSLTMIRASSTSSPPALATLHGSWSSGSLPEDLSLSLRVNSGGGDHPLSNACVSSRLTVASWTHTKKDRRGSTTKRPI